MPRVTTVKKCRKSPGACGKCQAKIKKGDSYVWWKFRRGGVQVRCSKATCHPKASDLTQSEFWGAVYSLQESVKSFTTADDVESCIEDLKGEIETLRDECQEKFDNMPEGLQQGDTGQLLEERIGACDDVISQLEGIETDYEPEENAADDDDAALTAWLEDKASEIDGALEFSCS